MVSLDGSPSGGEHSHLVHWIVTDIPDGGGIDQGRTVVPYLQPLPFYGTGLHRVVFLLFRHKQPLDFEHVSSRSSSMCLTCFSDPLSSRVFSTPDFYKHRDELLTPSSLCFFQTQWDVSVRDKLHELGSSL